MPAPAPVNVSVKPNPTTPKQKVDAPPRDDAQGAPRFDDALKQARAKPAKAEKPAEVRGAVKVQRSSKSKSSKRTEAPAEVRPPEDAGHVEPALPSPEDAPLADVKNVSEPSATSKPALAEVEATNLAAVTIGQSAPVYPAAEPLSDEGGDGSSAPAGSTPVAAVRVAKQSDVTTGLTTESTAAPADADPTVATGADEEAAATPEGALPPASTLKPQNLDGEPTPDQPQDIAPPTVVKPGGKQQQQHPQHQPGDQPPVPAIDLPADVQPNTDAGETEQQAATVGASQPAVAGESPAAQPPANAITPTSASADVMSAASVAPKSTSQTENTPAPAAAPATPTPREVEFARANHERIVTDIRAQLLPKGGAMQIRLDPPQLGALQVAVHMLDGVMSVSFETSNTEATQMLSHSLTQLKHVLESHGVSVDKLHVQQAPRNEQSSNNSNDPDQQREQRGGAQDDNLARQEQQRKEMLRRMWRRLALGNDPLDLVA